jgi:insertion element IS1 protein InsB
MDPNGPYSKQRYKCKDCGRQFIKDRKNVSLSQEQKVLIKDMLLERISLEGICRVLKISLYHLYKYMDQLYEQIPDDLHIGNLIAHQQDVDLQYFECENDEAWSFVGNKGNKQWIWMAMHRSSPMIVGLFVGEGGNEGAQGLFNSISEAIKEKAIFYTDGWEAYKKVFIEADHRPSKKKKERNHIERFWATLRQRCSRLVRMILSFSKKQQRHQDAIRYFVANYNLALSLLL